MPRDGQGPTWTDCECLSLSFKALGGGLWDYDVVGDVLYCNPKWYEIIGLDQLITPISSLADFVPHIHPDDREIATAVDFEKLSDLIARDERYDVEFRIVRPDGAIRWLRSVASLVGDPAARSVRAVGCVIDITEYRTGASPIELPVGTGAGHDEAAEAAVPELLSEKERECLIWVAAGKTAWETAVILGRSKRTVEFHLGNAIEKLGASNKVHAAVLAVRRGLL